MSQSGQESPSFRSSDEQLSDGLTAKQRERERAELKLRSLELGSTVSNVVYLEPRDTVEPPNNGHILSIVQRLSLLRR